MITSTTQLNTVIGFPIKHSQSPILHNALYEKLGINARMLAFENGSVKKLIHGIRAFDVGLTAVTMPFKQMVMRYLDFIDEPARSVGAVNTIINRGGKLYGYNTDILGIKDALRGVVIKNKNALVIGAGGAAKAVAYYIKTQKGRLLYLNRSKARALMLKKQFGGQVVSISDLQKMPIEIIVNATPVGMQPKLKATPLPKEFFRQGQYVFDLVYNPLRTHFLKEAKLKGAKTISGIEMFIGQAIGQIELFSRKKANERVRQFAKSLLTKNSNGIKEKRKKLR